MYCKPKFSKYCLNNKHKLVESYSNTGTKYYSCKYCLRIFFDKIENYSKY